MPVVRAGVRVRSRHAETLTGIVVTVPQKRKGEGNLTASSAAMCAERHGAEASKSIGRDCCGLCCECAALLLPDSA